MVVLGFAGVHASVKVTGLTDFQGADTLDADLSEFGVVSDNHLVLHPLNFGLREQILYDIRNTPMSDNHHLTGGVDSIYVCDTFDGSGHSACSRLGSFKGTAMVRTRWGPAGNVTYLTLPADLPPLRPPPPPPPSPTITEILKVKNPSKIISMLQSSWRPGRLSAQGGDERLRRKANKGR